MHQPRRINFNRYPLKRIVRAKEKGGFVKYECELVGLKTTAWMRESEFEEREDFDKLMKFVESASGKMNRKINSRNMIVKRIVGHRYLENGKRVYNIEWDGWTHMCWREEKTAPELKGAKKLLNAYRKEHGLRQHTEWSDDESSEEEEEEEVVDDEDSEEQEEDDAEPMEDEVEDEDEEEEDEDEDEDEDEEEEEADPIDADPIDAEVEENKQNELIEKENAPKIDGDAKN